MTLLHTLLKICTWFVLKDLLANEVNWYFSKYLPLNCCKRDYLWIWRSFNRLTIVAYFVYFIFLVVNRIEFCVFYGSEVVWFTFISTRDFTRTLLTFSISSIRCQNANPSILCFWRTHKYGGRLLLTDRIYRLARQCIYIFFSYATKDFYAYYINLWFVILNSQFEING